MGTQLEPGLKAIPVPPKTVLQNVRRILQAFSAAFFVPQTGPCFREDTPERARKTSLNEIWMLPK